MSGAIEEAAKKWLVDPAYQKVFKHTFDVIEDYVNYGLIAVGAVALSVRFLTSLGTGDVVCIIMGVTSHNASLKDLGPYPSGGTITMVNYANFNKKCVDSSLTMFMQYSPFLLLMQALIIIMVEKFFLKIPRVAGKIERFYINIVEESLFGKDPDVAEDVCDDKANTEAISRRRRRNEVCMSLKRSSVIHQTYVLKNILEMILLTFFIPLNLIFCFEAEVNKHPSTCHIELVEILPLNLMNGTVHFQCEGKKVHFFLILIYVQVVMLMACFICCAGSLFWCLFFRSISRLLKNIEKVCFEYDLELDSEKQVGEDFLFLFDLLAHSSGIESTLRVLTHSDDTFRRICLPRLRVDSEHIKVEEDKLKIIWHAAGIEKWLLEHSHREIRVDSYDVTIFPAESIKNSVSKKAKLKAEAEEDDKYSAWFFDLAGGKTEYIVTIACVIGRSRMKGERIITTLLPYGAEKPRAGMLKVAGTQEVELAWEPPKGDFTKYVLSVEPLLPLAPGTVLIPGLAPPYQNSSFLFTQNSRVSAASNMNNVGSFGDLSKASAGYKERELSNKLTNFTIAGLSPGETYRIELKTKTGDRMTRQPIQETVLTKPERVTSLTVDEVQTEKALLKWVAPEGHARLKAFNILCVSKDNKSRRELAVKHSPNIPVNSFLLENLPSANEFSVTVTTVCVFEKLKTLSDEERITFVTLPLPPRNLELESRFCNSFQVKWEASASSGTANHKYKLNIQSPSIGYTNNYEVSGERHTFNFSKLPEITGTGELYTVKIVYSVQPVGSDSEVDSEPLIGQFYTKPLAPTNFKLGSNRHEIVWTKSATPNISYYKIRYKSIEEGSKPEESLLPPPDEGVDMCYFTLQNLNSSIQYKVNIYAVVEGDGGEAVESKELHEKVIVIDGDLAIYSEDMDRVGSSLSRQVSEMP